MTDEMATEDRSRARGLLSDADREYLRDPEGYGAIRTRQSVLERERQIESRLRNGLQDFSILAEYLDDEDAERILSTEGTRAEREPYLDGARDAFALLYRVYGDKPKPFDFASLLKAGVRREIERDDDDDGPPPLVDVTFEVDHLPETTYGEIHARLARGELDELSDGEYRMVLRTLHDSDYDVAELFGDATRNVISTDTSTPHD